MCVGFLLTNSGIGVGSSFSTLSYRRCCCSCCFRNLVFGKDVVFGTNFLVPIRISVKGIVHRYFFPRQYVPERYVGTHVWIGGMVGQSTGVGWVRMKEIIVVIFLLVIVIVVVDVGRCCCFCSCRCYIGIIVTLGAIFRRGNNWWWCHGFRRRRRWQDESLPQIELNFRCVVSESAVDVGLQVVVMDGCDAVGPYPQLGSLWYALHRKDAFMAFSIPQSFFDLHGN